MNILTFDLEEWFHLLDHDSTRTEREWVGFPSRIRPNTDRVLGVLAKNRLRATFFCLGWIAESYPDVIKKIRAAGHEIGCHSHRHQLIHQQTPAEFRGDLGRAVKTLEDLTGAKVRAFRAPGFSLTPATIWALEVLNEQGIELDSSVFPGRHAHGGFAKFSGAETSSPFTIEHAGVAIREYPINCCSFAGQHLVFSGGGYFRLMPYLLIEKLMARSPYVMMYFHPRDFDTGQPMLWDLPWIRLFRSYWGLGSSLGKLERLLRDFRFVSLCEADATTDWTHPKVTRL